jgi:hypothetical protein
MKDVADVQTELKELLAGILVARVVEEGAGKNPVVDFGDEEIIRCRIGGLLDDLGRQFERRRGGEAQKFEEAA